MSRERKVVRRRRVRRDRPVPRPFIPAPEWQILPADPKIIEQTGAAAYADEAAKAVRFQGRPRRRDPVDQFIVANEVGHLLDYQYLTDKDRARLMRLMGLRGKWNTDAFSDYYASLAAGTGTSVTGDVTVNPRRLRRIGNSLERLGERYNLERYQGY